MATDECILRSKGYEEMQITPSGTAIAGEVVQESGVLCFYLTDFTAAMLALSEEASVIYRAEKAQVIKAAGTAWAPGDPVYWDAAGSQFVVADTGALTLAGFVIEVAASAAVTGFITFIGDAELIGGQAGLKIKYGSSSFTGTIADVATGLTVILAAFTNVKETAQAAGDPAYCTVDHGADDKLDIYAWDDAGVEAANAGVVYWLVIGT